MASVTTSTTRDLKVMLALFVASAAGACNTTCGESVRNLWIGYDDGSNHCNMCVCLLGKMRCTKNECAPHTCPVVLPEDPCETQLCAAGTTCHVDEAGSPQCLRDCQTHCGESVPHGWTGSDDGNNHCNTCTCADGELACTKVACTPRPCAGEVCTANSTTCGHLFGACGTNYVCLDDPADECEPSVTQLCGACCVFNECALTKCETGTMCQLDSFGMPQCVAVPDTCCEAEPSCPTGYDEEVASCTRTEFERGICTQVSSCCKSIICKVYLQ